MFCNRAHMFRDPDLREFGMRTNPGERIVDVYKLTYEDDGTETLVVCGKKDVYEEIQSHADSVDVHKIVERCTMTGDTSELYKTPGFFGDLTEMPETRAEALQMLAEAHHKWDQLPVDVKKKFDNDVNKFFVSAFTDEWFEKLKIPEEVVKKTEEGDVNE